MGDIRKLLMNKGLLRKYCNNSCTNEELETVLEWFKESADKPEGKTLLLGIWEEQEIEEINPDVNFDLIIDRIHHKINLKLEKSEHIDPLKKE
jgi:hypothetical protein